MNRAERAERQPDEELPAPPLLPGEDLYLSIGPKGVLMHDPTNPEAWIKATSFEWLKWNR